MNYSIIAPVFLLSLTCAILVTVFICPGPIYAVCRVAFAPLRRRHRQHREQQQQQQQTSRRGSGRAEQTDVEGQTQHQQHQQRPGRELDDLPAVRE